MWNCNLRAAALAVFLAAASVKAASCKKADADVADGYQAWLVSDDLHDPRGMIFDSAGHALVVESGKGISALTLENSDNCVAVASKKTVVSNGGLNHGIELSMDGKTLYGSSTESVWSWPYDPKTATATMNKQKTLVSNMTNTDHTTRTLLMSRKMPGMLLVSRGSTSNIDPLAARLDSGHSQIKAFNLNKWTKTYDFVHDGLLLGWGLRNDVGVAEEPMTGNIYSVENSVDEMNRMGVDIHKDDPGEELNFFGTLKNNQSPNQGNNFGYPECYSVWGLNDIPMRQGLDVGMQFAIGDSDNIKLEDNKCHENKIAPRLVFQAHMAPLDIKFDSDGSTAWITFHGSWDREPAVGYKVSMVKFANGEPLAKSTSRRAAIDIVSNVDTAKCPSGCFRPVGLAWDPYGRLMFTSDETGELYMITKKGAKMGGVDSGKSTASSSGTVDGGNAAPLGASVSSIWVVALTTAVAVTLFM